MSQQDFDDIAALTDEEVVHFLDTARDDAYWEVFDNTRSTAIARLVNHVRTVRATA